MEGLGIDGDDDGVRDKGVLPEILLVCDEPCVDVVTSCGDWLGL